MPAFPSRRRSSIGRRWFVGAQLGIAVLLLSCHLDKLFKPPRTATLLVSPAALADSVAVGSTTPTHRVIAVRSSSRRLAWHAAVMASSAWLELGRTEDTVPSDIDVILDPGGLATGAYRDTIVVTATGPDVQATRVPVTLVVHPLPPPPPPPPPRRVAFVVQPTTTVVNGTIMPPVRVAALDSAGNTVTGFVGRITVAIGSNPTGGALHGTTGVDAVSGVATFGDLSIDKEGSGYTVAASSDGLSGATSGLFDVLGTGGGTSATHLWYLSQPTTTPGGQPITPVIRVAAQDRNGQVVTDYTGAITMSLRINPSCGVLSGTLTVGAVNGVATFDDLRVDKGGNGYTLLAQAAGLTEMESGAFNVLTSGVTGCGQPTHLVILVQPGSTRAGAAITPAIRVAAHDNSGNIAGGFTGDITMSIGSKPSGGTLSGTVTVTAVNGVATFNNLMIDKTGTGYTLVAKAAGFIDGETGAFNIVQ